MIIDDIGVENVLKKRVSMKISNGQNNQGREDKTNY